jgi:trimethylamine--corrinoid protein Co-methyltransferase
MGLQSAALTMMGRFYGLPSTSAGCTSDALDPGPQAVLEKLVTTLPPVLVGADIIVGIGEIEGDQLLVLEQMIIDHEIACYCQRLCEGVDTSEEKSLFEDIARVGPGGHFLTSKSTRQAPRGGEFYFPAIIDRFSYEAWAELGRPSMHAKARQKVRAILEGPRVDPLPEEVDQEIEEILRAADRELEAE